MKNVASRNKKDKANRSIRRATGSVKRSHRGPRTLIKWICLSLTLIAPGPWIADVVAVWAEQCHTRLKEMAAAQQLQLTCPAPAPVPELPRQPVICQTQPPACGGR